VSRGEARCCVCGCTQTNACDIVCSWVKPVWVTTNAQQHVKDLRHLCSTCEPIIKPLLQRVDWSNVLVTARKIRRGLERIGAL
jgi:hypothetical protein